MRGRLYRFLPPSSHPAPEDTVSFPLPLVNFFTRSLPLPNDESNHLAEFDLENGRTARDHLKGALVARVWRF